MRRMITNKQVVEVVNKAIDDGEIEIGGLPEIESGDAGKVLKVNEQEDGVEWGEAGGADNALVLPEEAPAAQQLVGINTSNEQNSLGIGNGLKVESGNIVADPDIKTITLDFGSATTLTVSEDIATNVTNQVYDFIFVKTSGSVYSLPRAISNLSPYGLRFFTGVGASTTNVKWLSAAGNSQCRLQVQDSTTLKITISSPSVLTESGDASRISMEIPATETSVAAYGLMQWAYPNNKLQTWATYYAQISGNTVFFYPTYYDATNHLLYLRSQVCSANSTVYEAVINTSTKKASYSTVS